MSFHSGSDIWSEKTIDEIQLEFIKEYKKLRLQNCTPEKAIRDVWCQLGLCNGEGEWGAHQYIDALHRIYRSWIDYNGKWVKNYYIPVGILFGLPNCEGISAAMENKAISEVIKWLEREANHFVE